MINKICEYMYMKNIVKALKKYEPAEVVLGILMIIFLIMGYKMPMSISQALDSFIGKMVMLLIVVFMFVYTNPILAILALLVAFKIMMSGNNSDVNVMQAIEEAPSEENKSSQLTQFNQFPYTLEQEMVKQMAPIMKPGSSISKAEYKPVLENNYDASPVNSGN
jgi:hypothetical protein